MSQETFREQSQEGLLERVTFIPTLEKERGWSHKEEKDRYKEASQKSTWYVLRTERSPVSKEKRGGCMKYEVGHIRSF